MIIRKLKLSKKIFLSLATVCFLSSSAFATSYSCNPGQKEIRIPIHDVKFYKPFGIAPLNKVGNWVRVEYLYEGLPIDGIEIDYDLNFPTDLPKRIYAQILDYNGKVLTGKYLSLRKRCVPGTGCVESYSLPGSLGGQYVSRGDAIGSFNARHGVRRIRLWFYGASGTDQSGRTYGPKDHTPVIKDVRTFRRYSVPGSPIPCN